MTATEDVIKAAMGIAKDAAEGRLSPVDLDIELTAQCRSLFGVVAGPGDPLWPLHVDVARQVLAAGGLSLDECREWIAVLERRAVDAVEITQPADAPDMPADGISSASGPHSAENDGFESCCEPEEDPRE